jgi:hypothetical protein
MQFGPYAMPTTKHLDHHSRIISMGIDLVTSPLTGIDPHLLMRINPPELYSGFDPSLIF